MSKTTGGPAFPTPAAEFPNGEVYYGSFGMTLRDCFAMNAPAKEIYDLIPATREGCAELLGIDSDEYMLNWRIHYPRVLAKVRYQWADAMLEERQK